MAPKKPGEILPHLGGNFVSDVNELTEVGIEPRLRKIVTQSRSERFRTPCGCLRGGGEIRPVDAYHLEVRRAEFIEPLE